MTERPGRQAGPGSARTRQRSPPGAKPVETTCFNKWFGGFTLGANIGVWPDAIGWLDGSMQAWLECGGPHADRGAAARRVVHPRDRACAGPLCGGGVGRGGAPRRQGGLQGARGAGTGGLCAQPLRPQGQAEGRGRAVRRARRPVAPGLVAGADRRQAQTDRGRGGTAGQHRGVARGDPRGPLCPAARRAAPRVDRLAAPGQAAAWPHARGQRAARHAVRHDAHRGAARRRGRAPGAPATGRAT